MERKCQTWDILWRSFLTFTLFAITNCIAFRLDDSQSAVKLIPLTRVNHNGGFRFHRGNNFQFEREIKELNELRYRFRRSTGGSVRVHNNTRITEEFELDGDNHTVAFLHWSGKDSSVIYIYTCGKVNQTESGNFICEDGFFWRSTDYGTTFKHEDYKFKSQPTNNIDFCSSNYTMVMVSVSVPKKSYLYVSYDEGKTFTSQPLSFTPHVVSCSPVSYKVLVAQDQDTKEVCGISYSLLKIYYMNDGERWIYLADHVLRHYWAPNQGGKKSELLLEVQNRHKYHTSYLKHAFLPCDKDCLKDFDKFLGPFSSHSLKVEGKYVFVEKDTYNTDLYVFYKSNSSKNFFQKAQFPPDIEKKSYTIVDAKEGEVMVVVRHEKEHDGKDYYNLYVSDLTGVKYSLSLENILSSRTPIWGKNTTLVDLHRVKSLNGTYLANVFILDGDGGRDVKFRSVITFNKGGEWFPLKAPLVDHRGNPTNCHPPKCSLHVHMVLGRWYLYIPPVLSSSSAVGIIVAQGNLGSRLGERPVGLFLSRDGGLSWTKEFNGYHDFVIGDHGGILAAVPLVRNADTVWYSCTEGQAWKNVSLGKEPVTVFGMVTEPGGTTLIINVFGQHTGRTFKWLSVKLNFTSVLNQKCLADNYTTWSPNDERIDGECLLGQHFVYERRKSGDCCFNGKEYEREINITTCACEEDDFECDFGYEHSELSKVCEPTADAAPVPAHCPEGKTYPHSRGYRKVVGDRCKGGREDKLMPEIRNCPIKAPSDLRITFGKLYVETNTKVTFSLAQGQGSTESTWYEWNFGDGSKRKNITGLSNAENISHIFRHHGTYNVSVAAGNTAGQDNGTTEVIVLDLIKEVDIEPPHAVVVGVEAWFNATLHSTARAPQQTSSPNFGLTHYMWTFDQNDKNTLPLLTWESEVHYVYNKAGIYKVSVQASNGIGQTIGSTTVTVYDNLLTVRLLFDAVLDENNDKTWQWREFFAKRLETALSKMLDVDPKRLEVFVLRGLPTRSDVSIVPAQTNTSKSADEIVDLLKFKVEMGSVKIQLPKDLTVRVTHVEVLPNRDYGGGGLYPTQSSDSGSGTKLAIGVGVAAALVVVFLVGTLVYFLRRYNLLRSRYTHLRLYSDGAQLRDPLVESDDCENEESLHPQPGGSLRYVPIPTSAAPDADSDEELIDNFGTGSLALLPHSQNDPGHGGNTNN